MPYLFDDPLADRIASSDFRLAFNCDDDVPNLDRRALKKGASLSCPNRKEISLRSTPVQVSSPDTPAGIIVISGASIFCSSIEMEMALFLEGRAIIRKPHQINATAD